MIIHQARIETIGMHCFNIDFYSLPVVALLAEMEGSRTVVVRAGTAHMPHSTQCDWQLAKHQSLPQ